VAITGSAKGPAWRGRGAVLVSAALHVVLAAALVRLVGRGGSPEVEPGVAIEGRVQAVEVVAAPAPGPGGAPERAEPPAPAVVRQAPTALAQAAHQVPQPTGEATGSGPPIAGAARPVAARAGAAPTGTGGAREAGAGPGPGATAGGAGPGQGPGAGGAGPGAAAAPRLLLRSPDIDEFQARPEPHLPGPVRAHHRGTEVVFTAELCAGTDGAVERVTIGLGVPGADGAIVETLRRWRLRPQPFPICWPERIEFTVE